MHGLLFVEIDVIPSLRLLPRHGTKAIRSEVS